MCLPRYQFCLAEAEKRVFFVSEDTPQEMHALSRIFHLKAQNEPSLVQTRVKAKDRKQAQTLLFPSVRWSKSWNLRETDCEFEWKVFFVVLLGFAPLLPTPGFSRCVA
jgi:hypothetical protein